MASNILHFKDSPGAVDYAVILDDTGQVWNGSAMAAYAVGSWATYAVLLSVPDAAGHATLTLPALPAGNYTVDVRRRAGGAAAATDTQAGTGDFVWNGTKILTVADAAGGGGGADPWATALPGAYGAGTAGNIVGADLPALLVSIGTGLHTELDAVKAKTDNLPASPAAVGSAMALTSGERNSVADALLDRPIGAHVTAGTVGRALQIARANGRGKWLIDAAANTLTLYDTDDTTVIATFDLTPHGGPYTGRTPVAE